MTDPLTPETLIAEARKQSAILFNTGDCTIDHCYPSEIIDRLVAALALEQRRLDWLMDNLEWTASRAYIDAALAKEAP